MIKVIISNTRKNNENKNHSKKKKHSKIVRVRILAIVSNNRKKLHKAPSPSDAKLLINVTIWSMAPQPPTSELGWEGFLVLGVEFRA